MQSKHAKLAINGKVFRFLYDNRNKPGYEGLLETVLECTVVYGSMSPDDKALLV